MIAQGAYENLKRDMTFLCVASKGYEPMNCTEHQSDRGILSIKNRISILIQSARGSLYLFWNGPVYP